MGDQIGSVIADENGIDLANVVNDSGTGRLAVDAKLTGLGTVVINVGGNPCSEKWTSLPANIPGTFVDIYTKTGSAIFYQAIWQLNTDKMQVQVEVDGVTKYDFDLEELKKDFKLKQDGHDSGGWEVFPIWRYESKRWAFKPPVPTKFSASFKIKFKSNSGTKKVERGYSIVGDQ